MKIVFWNIRKNSDVSLIARLVEKTMPDVLFLAECNEKLASEITKTYPAIIERIEIDNGIKGFDISGLVSCKPVEEQKRCRFYRLGWEGKTHLLGVLHLPYKLWRNVAGQSIFAREFSRRLVELENMHGEKTILIGDFNMNPFEPGMVEPDSFNSVSSPFVALTKSRCVDGTEYEFFYNPCWKAFVERGAVYGTYYRVPSNPGALYWNVFDQALIRPSILDCHECFFDVLHDVIDFDLTRECHRKRFSDHYPILLERRSCR